MAEIDGGALSFKSVMDNDQLNVAIEETLRRVQGFSDAVVGRVKQWIQPHKKWLNVSRFRNKSFRIWKQVFPN